MTNALEFPISIGIVGAPGSGKKPLVEEFQVISADWFAENESPLNVVSNAGQAIEDEFDIAMGSFGGWEMDVRAYWHRVEREDKSRIAKESFISVGTALEHLAHCGTNMETVIMGIQTPQQQQRLQTYQVGMTALTYLTVAGFRYHFAFYLPFQGTSLVVPGTDQTENDYGMKVDSGLRQIFGNFGLRIQMLEGRTTEEQAQEVFDTVKRIVEEGPDVPPEEAIPGQDQTEVVEPEPSDEEIDPTQSEVE